MVSAEALWIEAQARALHPWLVHGRKPWPKALPRLPNGFNLSHRYFAEVPGYGIATSRYSLVAGELRAVMRRKTR